MNLKTTLALVALVFAGGVLFWLGPTLSLQLGLAPRPVDAAGAGSLNILQADLTPEKLTRIEIRHDNKKVVLEGGPGRDWTLPGQWPTRQPEVEKLVGLLTNDCQQSRFVPIALGNPPELKKYGLDPSQKPVTVTVQAGAKTHLLTFGESDEQDQNDPFIRPTYLRLDDQPEALRLGPGIMTALQAAPDYYQKRRLFPSFVRVKIKTTEPPEGLSQAPDAAEQEKTIDLFGARELAVQGPDGSYILKQIGQKLPRQANDETLDSGALTLEDIARDWELDGPVRDQPDEKKLETILTVLPDIWAEQFTEKTDVLDAVGSLLAAAVSLDTPISGAASLGVWTGIAWQSQSAEWYLGKFGLAAPDRTLRVTRADGDTVTLLIGKPVGPESGESPFPDAPSPDPEQGKGLRYAKLQGNDQIFTIKTDKLDSGLFIAVKDLRDPHLVHFHPDDAQRLQVAYGGQNILFVKDKNQWRMQQPLQTEAESDEVGALIKKLSELEARGDDVSYKDEPGFGFSDKSAGTIQVDVQESDGKNPHKPRTLTFNLGKHEGNKVYVRLQGWDRINAVEDSVLKLIQRPALVYRSRQVLNFLPDQLARVEVHEGSEKFSLEQDKSTWRLAEPVRVEADRAKVEQLVSNLQSLKAVEFVSDAPSQADLDKVYGLAKPSVSVTLTFTKPEMPSQTFIIGNKHGEKPEYYARLMAWPGAPAQGAAEAPVFSIKKEVRDALEQGSLAYRPLQLWDMQPEEVAEIRLQKEGQEYHLKRAGPGWQITEPFEAPALSSIVDPMVKEVANLRCERYEAHTAADLARYGLDHPYLSLTVVPAVKEEPKEERLFLGKPTSPGANTRYGKLASGQEGIFVVSEALVKAVDHGALDLIDHNLMALDPRTITRIRSTLEEDVLTLQRDGDHWQAEGPTGKFTADPEVMDGLLKVWSSLKAERFEAYGGKVDLAAYLLDKPAIRMVVTVQPLPTDGAAAKPVEHTLSLGGLVPGDATQRYGRLDQLSTVFILNADAVSELSRPPLGFVEHNLLTFDPGKVTAIDRRMGEQELALAKRDDGWHLMKPVEQRADDEVLEELVQQLSHLRADGVAAYQAKDLKPFGLEQPVAVVTLRLAEGEGQPAEYRLKVGARQEIKNMTVGMSPPRYVQVDGSPVVATLLGGIPERLLADPVKFRDRSMARFTDADRAVLERGPRKAVFANVNGTWRMVEPVEADAEQTEMDDLINALATLKADELTAENPEDLKPYGLDRPAVSWHLYSGQKEVLGLLIGTNVRGKGGEERCYAKLAAGDLVFLLDPRLTTKVLGEYRSRNVWASFDAAQVDLVRYAYSGHPFVLEKEGSAWHVQGQAEIKVKPEAISETLDALSHLRAERFVIDKEADSKLYGLEPPQLVLEIGTPAGKRLLQVGHSEGDSKRYYARVAGENRSDVFIIPEDAAARILRQLTAFTEGSEAKGTEKNGKP